MNKFIVIFLLLFQVCLHLDAGSGSFFHGIYSQPNDGPGGSVLAYPAETIVTTFASGHGWTKQSSEGTQSDDTVNFVKGLQSLKLVTDGAGDVIFTRKTSIFPTIDASSKYIKLWVRVDDVSIVTEYWFFASSDNLSSAFHTWKLSDDFSQIKNDNTWVPITLSFGEAVVTGSPNRSALNSFRWRIKDDAETALTANLGAIALVPEPQSGAVTIAFDDGWDSQFDQGRLKMDEYGFAGTAYIIPDLIGTSNYMTLAQLKSLQDISGWDISWHHATNLTTLTQAQVTSELITVKNYLLDNGLIRGAGEFAYPNGAYDETIVLPTVKRYFRTARTIANYAETIAPADYHRLRVMQVLNTTSTSDVATAVDKASVDKEWLILLFHKLVVSPSVSSEYSIANFGTIIDDIQSDGIPVRTVSDIINNGLTGGNFMIFSATSGITASTTQTQGQGPLTSDINEISVVANNDDVVTLSPAFVRMKIEVINNGSNTLQIFPALGDNLGLGVNLSEELELNETVTFSSHKNTFWAKESTTEIIHAEMHDQDNTDAFVIVDAGADFQSYHTNGLVGGDIADWTFDAGGAGTSFPIASISDWTGGKIIVATTGTHGLAIGDIISQANLSDSAYVGAFDFQVCNGVTIVTGSKVREQSKNAGIFAAISGGGIMTVASGDKLSFAFSNEDSSRNITIRNFTIYFMRL